jgi:hypothetical protein
MIQEFFIDRRTKVEYVFELIERLVGGEGGDGWGEIVAEDYKELAKIYDQWRFTYDSQSRKRLGGYWYRDDYEEYEQIVFSDRSNESITFTKRLPVPDITEFIIHY